MADLYSYLVPSLIAGVSQQSDAQRDPTQAEVMLNGVASTTEGLRKREGSQLLAKVSNDPLGDITVHAILRDTKEKYLAVIGKGTLRVFDLAGQEHQVHTVAPGHLSYLSSVVDAKADIRAVSLADYTFISNTRVTPQADADKLTPVNGRPWAHEALIFVKAANFGQQYRVVVNGVEAVIATPVAPVISTDKNGILDVKENRVDAGEIAQKILEALGPKTWGVRYLRSGSVLYLGSPDPISVGATDAQGGQDIVAITDTVQSFTTLPARAPNGYQIAVEGRPDTDVDDYFLTFKVRAGQGDFGEGSWMESAASGMEYRVNPETMPHVLVRLSDGSFLLSPLDGREFMGITLKKWGDRTAGDYTSAPDPSFIGKPINDIFIYRNRLGFLADESVILSRPGDFFDFFPESVTSTSDADPIDIVASGSRVSILRYAVPAQNELVLFSDQTQFRLGTDAVGLTASTVSVNVLTQYEIDTRVRPIQVGGSIVFCQANGEWSRFQEMRLRGSGASVVADVDDLTQQVPSYIPTGVFALDVEQASGSWYAVSDLPGYENDLWVNKFYWRNSGDGLARIQNAWSQWTIAGVRKVLQVLCLQEKLYLLTEAEGAVWLEALPTTDPSPRARLLPNGPLLDRWFCAPPMKPKAKWHDMSPRVVAPGAPSYDEVTKTTTWALPFWVNEPHEVWSGLEGEKGMHKIGVLLRGDTFRAAGDWRKSQAVFGIPFPFRYRFTRFKPYKQEATAKVARSVVRAQVRKAMLRYHHSDFFQVAVLAEGREPALYTFDKTQMGTRNNRLGELPWDLERSLEEERYREGAFSIPILGRGDTTVVEIRNDTPLPCKFSSLEYIGLLHGKAA